MQYESHPYEIRVPVYSCKGCGATWRPEGKHLRGLAARDAANPEDHVSLGQCAPPPWFAVVPAGAICAENVHGPEACVRFVAEVRQVKPEYLCPNCTRALAGFRPAPAR